jgi:putative transposase
LFGNITDKKMILNDYGHIVSDEWKKTAMIRPGVQLDAWVVMPDHFHGIIIIANDGGRAPGGEKTVCRDTAHCDGDITYCRDTARRVPTKITRVPAMRHIPAINHTPASTTEHFGKPVPGSLPTIIRSFKSAITKRINEIRQTPGAPVWQKNYDERIIKNELYLNRIRQYIRQNPVNWEEDQKC